jgi:hypothetical protein
LNLNLTKATYDVRLITIWDDYTEIDTSENDHEFEFVEEEEGKTLHLNHPKPL